MKKSYPKILRNRKRRIQRRLNPGPGWSDQAEPIMRASNIHYEMAEKARAVNCGGIGAIHLMVNKLGLRQEIDSRLHLLKKHLPLHAIVLLPAQIVRAGRRVIYRIMSYNNWLKDLFANWEHLRRLDAT